MKLKKIKMIFGELLIKYKNKPKDYMIYRKYLNIINNKNKYLLNHLHIHIVKLIMLAKNYKKTQSTLKNTNNLYHV